MIHFFLSNQASFLRICCSCNFNLTAPHGDVKIIFIVIQVLVKMEPNLPLFCVYLSWIENLNQRTLLNYVLYSHCFKLLLLPLLSFECNKCSNRFRYWHCKRCSIMLLLFHLNLKQIFSFTVFQNSQINGIIFFCCIT